MHATPAKTEEIYYVVTDALQASISSVSEYNTIAIKDLWIQLPIFSDPPLSESDIPVGSWLCNSCRFKSKDDEEEGVEKPSNMSVTSTRRTKKRSGSTESQLAPKKTVSSPFDELIKAAISMNPKQFKLPKELELHHQFPGFDKGSLFLRIKLKYALLRVSCSNSYQKFNKKTKRAETVRNGFVWNGSTSC